MEFELRKGTDRLQLSKQAKRKPAMELPTLPQELIMEILTWLPVNSLLRFRCVSKWFKTLISSPNFVKAHLKSMKALSRIKPNQVDRILRNRSLGMLSYSVCSFYNDEPVDAVRLDHSPAAAYNKHEVVGACNGILCIVVHLEIPSKRSEVILWNPSIRVSYKLPACVENDGQSQYTVFGFGYDSRTDDYKVVKVCVDTDQCMAEVCSLRSKQWRKIEDFEYGVPVPDPRSGSGKLVAGCVHWPYLADYTPHRRDYGSEDFILSLDLSTETDNKVMLPCSRREIFCWRLCAVNDCLCVSVVNKDHSIALWMMKDYGVSGSWTKLFSCHGAAGLGPPLYVLDNHRVLYQVASGILMFNNGSSRLATSGSESSSKTEEIHVYMETLVCPATEY